MQADVDVVIIGAGPAGSCAGALLAQAGCRVLCLERQQFPRFSIGESLLPHCMEFLEQAGLAEAVRQEPGFQFKNGAAFQRSQDYTTFDFTDKSSPGPGTTFQVQRARFDQLLAQGAEQAGMALRFGHQVEAIELLEQGARLEVRDEQGEPYSLTCRFLLDASGFGRVLPRLLDLEYPSGFPVRQALFCHVKDGIEDPAFDRNKILVTVHPTQPDIWFWLIPFGNGTASLGVVGRTEQLQAEGRDLQQRLFDQIAATPTLGQLLKQAELITPVRELTGYSANVRQLAGQNFALLGNAGEFLDPVFSSGVTIALRSASMVVPLVLRQLAGETIDWQAEYEKPLRHGIGVFKHFVEGWYDSSFQKVIFFGAKQPEVKRMICSILAGYAWDRNNPFVAETRRRLQTLVTLCSQDEPA